MHDVEEIALNVDERICPICGEIFKAKKGADLYDKFGEYVTTICWFCYSQKT